MKKYFVIVLFIFLFLLAKGQSGDNAPVVYDQFFNNYFLINPSLLNTDNKFNVTLGNRTLTGLFEGVNRFYADMNMLFGLKKDTRYHSFGLLAMNNRDGEYFSRTRFYGRYSWTTGLTEHSSISAGAAVGFINYAFRSSPASGGGSSAAPDANFGIWYLRGKVKLGIAYQQITRPLLKPLNQEFILENYFNLNLIYKLVFNEYNYIESNIYYKYQVEFPFYIEAAPIMTIHEKVEAGFNYRYDKGVAILAGLKSVIIGKNHFRFMVSYLISTRKPANTNDGVLEISFGYSLPK